MTALQLVPGDYWKVALPPPPPDISFADRLRLMAVAGDGDVWSSRPAVPLLDVDEAAAARVTTKLPCPWPETALLSDALSKSECARIISLFEATGGFGTGRAVASGPESVRRNDVLVWVAPPETVAALWKRIRPAVAEVSSGANGLNARMRCYRYGPGQAFLPHHDASQLSTVLRDGTLHEVPGRRSRLSCLIYLNGDDVMAADGDGEPDALTFTGGATALLPNGENGAPARVHPHTGSVLIFPHGDHPRSLLHAGEEVHRGTKYVIRTDVF